MPVPMGLGTHASRKPVRDARGDPLQGSGRTEVRPYMGQSGRSKECPLRLAPERPLPQDAGLKSPYGRGEQSSSAAKAALKTVALCRSSRPGRDKFRSDPLMTAVVGGPSYGGPFDSAQDRPSYGRQAGRDRVPRDADRYSANLVGPGHVEYQPGSLPDGAESRT